MRGLPVSLGFGFIAAMVVSILFIPYVKAAAIQTATSTGSDSAQAQQISTDNQQIATLNQEIATYQAQLQKVGADKKTLQSAINALDLERSKGRAQVALTQVQINTTQAQIWQLGGEMTKAKQTIATDQAALGGYLRSLQKADGKPLIVQMLSSGSLVAVWDDINATLKMQNAVQGQMQTLRIQEGNLADSQAASKQKQETLTSQKQTLASQQQSLVATEQSKTQLLAETKSQEAIYQKLLAAAEAELNSFSTFTQNAGGPKLLADQTSCNASGCYYNQRDVAWGSDTLDGTKYTLASAGCLIASVAMVLTHYGYRDVTPATINADPDNFAAYSPDLLLATISVDGATVTRKAVNVRGAAVARKVDVIDAMLATGHPAIVGMNALGGTHFVVLTSGSNGDYLMRDPYVANGNNISFSSHYSLKEIYSVARVVVSN